MLNSTVDPKMIENYSQRLSFMDGTTTWRYTWSPTNCDGGRNASDVSFDIEYTSFASRARAHVAATELRVTPHSTPKVPVKILDVFDGRSAKRSFLGDKTFGSIGEFEYMEVSNHPNGLPGVEAFTASLTNISGTNFRTNIVVPGNDHTQTTARSWDVLLTPSITNVFQKFIGAASSDHASFPRGLALATAKQAAEMGFEALLEEHKERWNELMRRELMTNYRDPGTGKLPESEEVLEGLQVAAVADRYFLMQSLLPEERVIGVEEFGGRDVNLHGLSVGGLSSDTYGGMLFWDQDLWMFPGIAITNPEYALQIIKARLKNYEQAKKNTQMEHVQKKYRFDDKAALFPWTSGRFGNETSTGPAIDYQVGCNLLWGTQTNHYQVPHQHRYCVHDSPIPNNHRR